MDLKANAISYNEAKNVLESFDGTDFQFEGPELPSKYQRGQIVNLDICPVLIPARILSVHFYNNKVKYDIAINVLNEDGWHTKRMYNIDEDILSV
jgi:hypothetical protein